MLLANILLAAATGENSVILGLGLISCVATFAMLLWKRGSSSHA